MKILCVVYCIQSERIVVLWRVQSSETIRITKQRQSSRASYIGTFFLYFFFISSFLRSFVYDSLFLSNSTQIHRLYSTHTEMNECWCSSWVGNTAHSTECFRENIFSVQQMLDGMSEFEWREVSEEDWEEHRNIHWTLNNSEFNPNRTNI
jgi:hypothetical protein